MWLEAGPNSIRIFLTDSEMCRTASYIQEYYCGFGPVDCIRRDRSSDRPGVFYNEESIWTIGVLRVDRLVSA